MCQMIVSLHHKVYYWISGQSKLQLFMEGANKTFCKLGEFCRFSMSGKDGKRWEQNFTETPRMICSLYTTVKPPIHPFIFM